MSNEEDFILRQERNLLDLENEQRASLGLDLKPIPELLMSELETEEAQDKKHSQEKYKAQMGFSEDTPVRFIEGDEEDEDEGETNDETNEGDD
jgi:hypothetical protein